MIKKEREKENNGKENGKENVKEFNIFDYSASNVKKISLQNEDLKEFIEENILPAAKAGLLAIKVPLFSNDIRTLPRTNREEGVILMKRLTIEELLMQLGYEIESAKYSYNNRDPKSEINTVISWKRS